MNLFGQAKKPEDPADQVKEWKRSIVREQRVMERDIQKIKKEEQKALVCSIMSISATLVV